MRYSLFVMLLLLVTSAPFAFAAKSAVALDSTAVATAESSFGNLLADAGRAALGAEVGLVNASQLRSVTIPAGNITYGLISPYIVYPNERIVLVEMPGEKLRAALERSVAIFSQPNNGFLQVSGLSFTFRSGQPAGARVQEVLIAGQPLVSDRVYRVALPESLAKGAQGYSRVFTGLTIRQTDGTIAQALTQYLSANQTLDLRPGSRIRNLG